MAKAHSTDRPAASPPLPPVELITPFDASGVSTPELSRSLRQSVLAAGDGALPPDGMALPQSVADRIRDLANGPGLPAAPVGPVVRVPGRPAHCLTNTAERMLDIVDGTVSVTVDDDDQGVTDVPPVALRGLPPEVWSLHRAIERALVAAGVVDRYLRNPPAEAPGVAGARARWLLGELVAAVRAARTLCDATPPDMFDRIATFVVMNQPRHNAHTEAFREACWLLARLPRKPGTASRWPEDRVDPDAVVGDLAGMAERLAGSPVIDDDGFRAEMRAELSMLAKSGVFPDRQPAPAVNPEVPAGVEGVQAKGGKGRNDGETPLHGPQPGGFFAWNGKLVRISGQPANLVKHIFEMEQPGQDPATTESCEELFYKGDAEITRSRRDALNQQFHTNKARANAALEDADCHISETSRGFYKVVDGKWSESADNPANKRPRKPTNKRSKTSLR